MPQASESVPFNEFIEQKARTDSGYAIAYALLKVADGQQSVAAALRMVGTAYAATPMGAIEFLASEVHNVASALGGIGEGVALKIHRQLPQQRIGEIEMSELIRVDRVAEGLRETILGIDSQQVSAHQAWVALPDAEKTVWREQAELAIALEAGRPNWRLPRSLILGIFKLRHYPADV